VLKFKRKFRRQRVNVDDEVAHPYKTIGKIIVLYVKKPGNPKYKGE